MNNTIYKGMGSDEYLLYETLDNGRNWKEVGESAIGIQAYDRIIYGSTENKGLRYSDDNGVTILESDHPTGNWDGINYRDNKVFAHSMDGDGIYYSQETDENGIGEIWHKLYDCPGGEVVEKDGYYQTEGMLITPEGKPVPNAVFENGEIVSKPISKYEGILTVILNDMVVPQLVILLTGSEDKETLAYFNDGITWGNTSYSSFFSEKELFHSTASYGEHMSSEDYMQIVGMMPISLKTEDFVGEVDTSNLSLSEAANLPENETLNKTLEIINNILEIKRAEAVDNMANKIMSVPVESDNLLDLDLTNEEYANALYMQKMFYEVQKSSILSIVGTILNAIYSFDTQRKISILKAAIYETAIKVAPSIQYQLKEIEKKINNSNFEITEDDLRIDYNFGYGLETAITNYLNTVFKNIKYVLDNPGDLKEHAAAWYKEQFRDEALEELSSFITTVSIPYEAYNYQNTLEQLNSLNDTIKSWYNSKRTFLEIIKDTVKDHPYYTSEEILNLINYDFEDGKNVLRENNIASEAIKNLEALEYNYDEELNSIFSDSENNGNEFTKNIYEKIYNKLNEELNTIEYDDYYNEDDDWGTDENIAVVQSLEKEIIEQFKKRCLELLELIYTNLINNVGENYYNELIKEQLEESIKLQDGDYNRDIESVLKVIHKNITNLIKTSWLKMKEMI